MRFSTHLLRPQFFDIFGGFMMGSFPHDFWVRIQIFGSEPESKTSLGDPQVGKAPRACEVQQVLLESRERFSGVCPWVSIGMTR